jgi:hypothetical protein
MRSPFPGMDPYLEGQAWPNFHLQLLGEMQARLAPGLLPGYHTYLEQRVYIDHPFGEPGQSVPDLVIARRETTGAPAGSGRVIPAPLEIPIPMPEERREAFLEIRRAGTRELVTVIEALSPANKRRDGDGRRLYLNKRAELIQNRISLVEIDLLRGGDRMPFEAPIPPADFCVAVCRSTRKWVAEFWPIALRDRLPEIPVPLLAPDGDAGLDLQAAFEGAFERGTFRATLDYLHGTVPPLPPDDQRWADALVAAA